jgi:hypothetical protein
VDLHRALQRQVGDLQLLGLFPLAGVQTGVGQGHAGLLGQDLQKEPLVLGRLQLRPDHQATRRPARGRHGVGPRPWHTRQLEPNAIRRDAAVEVGAR